MQTEARAVLEEKFALNQESMFLPTGDISCPKYFDQPRSLYPSSLQMISASPIVICSSQNFHLKSGIFLLIDTKFAHFIMKVFSVKKGTFGARYLIPALQVQAKFAQMFLKLCLPQVLLFVFYINCTSVAIQFSIFSRSGYFASLSRVCTNLSQVVFARSLYRHFYRKFTIHQHFCMQHHSFTFFLLKQEATWAAMGRKSGNYLNEGLNRGKIFEKHGQPNRRLSLQALSVPPKLFAKFVTFSLLALVISRR